METIRDETIDDRIFALVSTQRTLEKEGLLDPKLRGKIRRRVAVILNNLLKDAFGSDEPTETDKASVQVGDIVIPQEIERLIATSGNQHRFLKALIKFGPKGEIVPMKNLIKAVKGPKGEDTRQTRIELSGLVLRLRERMAGWAEIITVKGSGYCLKIL